MQIQKSISDQLSTLKYLPTLPHILLQLVKACNQNNSSIRDISNIVDKDPSLTSRVLRLVNSAFYSPSRKIDNVDDAVGFLGTNAVKNLAICSSVHEVFHKASMNAIFNMKLFWWHSLRCAILAKLIATQTRFNSPDEAFLSGVLHDIGKVVMWVNFPKQYADLLKTHTDRPDLVLAGETQMGATHAEIGAWLLDRWNFQSFIADSVLYHHYPVSRILDALPLVKLIYVANALSTESRHGLEQGYEAAQEVFGFSRSFVEELLSQTDGELKGVAESLGIEVEPLGTKEVSHSENDREKRKDLAQEIRDRSLLLGTMQNLLGAGDEQAVLRESYQGLQTLFDIGSVLLFVYESDRNGLRAVALAEDAKSGTINDLLVPLRMENSLLIGCLRTRTLLDSFSRSNESMPAILDEQIIRFLGRDGMVCLPMFAYGEPAGVMVLGVDQVEFSHLMSQIKLLKMFTDQAAVALGVHQLRRSQLAQIQSERFGASSSIARKVIHEVNNPLSIIKNYLKILGRKFAAQNMAQDEIKIINEEIDRVTQILRKLTAFSEDQANMAEAVDVNELLSDLLKITNESLLDHFNVKLHLDFEPDLPPIMADRNSLKQVFINLIKNAFEAMTEGGNLHIQTRHISSRIEEDLTSDHAEYSGYVEVIIHDDGPGIPAEIRTRLFEPLVTTKTGSHSGLGLSIVHNIIKAHNGTISCESDTAQGTTFKVGLPVSGSSKI
jgi:signal transduction histidine kinase/HD-like signal output (HDOD) protein